MVPEEAVRLIGQPIDWDSPTAPALAEKYRRAFLHKVEAQPGFLDTITFRDAGIKYLAEHHQAGHVNDETYARMLLDLDNDWVSPLHAYQGREITSHILRELHFKPMKAKGLARKTVDRYTLPVKWTCAYLTRDTILSPNPYFDINPKLDKPKPISRIVPVFEEGDRDRFFEFARTHSEGKWNLLLLIDYFVGARRNEILGLFVNRIDPKAGTILFDQQLTQDGKGFKDGLKNMPRRISYIEEGDLREHFVPAWRQHIQLLHENGLEVFGDVPLFPSKGVGCRDFGYTTSGVNKVFIALREYLGPRFCGGKDVRKFSTHALRHNITTQVLDRSPEQIKFLAATVGYTEETATKVYKQQMALRADEIARGLSKIREAL